MTSGRKVDNTLEQEATHFAMCLLMPRSMLMDEYEKMFPNGIELTNEENPIHKLSELFQVTDTMMWIRLSQIGVIK